MDDVRIIQGDCLEVMKTLADASVDAVVTDPPAGIAFMNKSWDNPANYPISDVGFTDGGNRRPLPTVGRSSRNGTCRKCGRRERGWKDVEPCQCHEPDFNETERRFRDRDFFIEFLSAVMAECLRVAKPGARALVWALPRTSHWTGTAIEDAGWVVEDRISHLFGSGFPKHKSKLKPACEDWWLAWKPDRKATPLNIDECRIAGIRDDTRIRSKEHMHGGNYANAQSVPSRTVAIVPESLGRWPANVAISHHPACESVGTKRVKASNQPGKRNGEIASAIGFGDVEGKPRQATYYTDPEAYGIEVVEAWSCHADCPVRLLDEQSGERQAGARPAQRGGGTSGYHGWPNGTDDGARIDFDSGGASRFFYCPKASRSDRGEGNTHPTVKNTDLMRWLCRLIAKPGDTILDPFMGSGSTLLAAKFEGMKVIGIEQSAEYVAEARRRLHEAELPLWRQETPA